jgi:lipopolysaccharide/colanic/teichoic acid biosynthesis glycosyltransferase
MAKRLFDVIASLLGLLISSALLLVIGAAVKLDSPGPVFFRQERVGRHGKTFRIHKFRTMVDGAERKGLQVTAGADPRVTRVGRVLRKHKLDELPQLIDVLCGSMSIVGPRPEVPKYVEHYPTGARTLVLSVRPGITDNASIEFVDEAALLGRSSEPEQTYLNTILPRKIELYCDYVRNRSMAGDLRIILLTVARLFD